MRIAYFDAFSGVSGDMTVGALLHLGLPLDAVRQAVASLGVTGVELDAEPTARSGITATAFRVGTARGHTAPHSHQPHEHGHRHDHRPYAEIRDLLAGSSLAAPVKERAAAIFARLAHAEGRVLGVSPDLVEFHEVGAVDAIVDVVGAALGFVHLGIDAVYASPLPMGQGRALAAHGVLPVPGPAVTELVRGRPVRFEDGAAELVTPTGAASALAPSRSRISTYGRWPCW